MDELEKIFGNNSQIDNMTYNDTKDDINLDRMSNTYRKGYRTSPPSNNQQDTLRDSITPQLVLALPIPPNNNLTLLFELWTSN